MLLASQYADLEQVRHGLRFGALLVWIVMTEEVRINSRVRRVADFLSTELGDLLRS